MVIFKNSFFHSIHLLGCRLDLIHKKNSLTLIQLGFVGGKRFWYIACESEHPKPRPFFLQSWDWYPSIRLGRTEFGTTTRPITAISPYKS